jgi:hypothetical protein
VNFFWAVHSVHHQSEEFNLAVALRQGWIEPLLIAPFHIPLALLGFPPEMFFIGFTAHTLWQFWPHTRGVGKLPIDGLFNSPSNHRCHHAINPEYIDKNYSGFLIIWDRIFGTWSRERQEPSYGTVKPLGSYNPLWANVSYWLEMARLMRACPRFVDKLSVPFRPPEWRPKELGGPVTIPEVSRETQRRYHVSATRAVNLYAVSVFAFVVLLLPVLTQPMSWLHPTWLTRVAIGAFFIASLVSSVGLIEARPWARALEWLRLLALPGVVWLAVPRGYAVPALGGAVALSLAQALWLASIARSRVAPVA